MAISEAERQEIIDLTGSMSVRDIATHVGVSKDAVFRVQKSIRGNPEAVAKPVATTSEIVARVRAQDKKGPVAVQDATTRDTSIRMGRNAIASIMTQQLISEMALYDKAKIRAEDDPQSKWEMVQHQKLIQSALRELAKWCGLDKGLMLGDEEDIKSSAGIDKKKLDRLKKTIDNNQEIFEQIVGEKDESE